MRLSETVFVLAMLEDPHAQHLLRSAPPSESGNALHYDTKRGLHDRVCLDLRDYTAQQHAFQCHLYAKSYKVHGSTEMLRDLWRQMILGLKGRV